MQGYRYQMFLPGGEWESGTVRAASYEEAENKVWWKAVEWTQSGDWGRGWSGEIPVHYRLRLFCQDYWSGWYVHEVHING